ncbi:HlyD family secretion protein [Ohtaekwangia koreensis]|uniref:HlyD family secretion protein n=1 Tax=Ohtaekwangia koreensis TaxID=688867 RepID=A0A1T5M757_9BACT|nr:HlyD family efflux transporter periplasmic adaptor subunit [Ohtaekwangia koreensis]SKC84066.1 HlyD family secretion protein [Ohtaekwangia koreensis]
MKKIMIIAVTAALLASCSGNENQYDASGTFEAVEVIIAAEASGTIQALNLEEGQVLQAGQAIGSIDSIQLYLRKKQLLAQIAAVLSKRPNVSSQLAALREQLKQAEREQQRITNLLKADAATQKQLDDANTQIAVIKKQIEAQQSSLNITAASLNEETLPLTVQVEQLNDQLKKCTLINPVNGTVLTKYAETNEMAVNGKPLYKIADLSVMILRAYITGDQFAQVKINQPVKALVDAAEGKYTEYTGTIEWISDKAEFTPKTIQTKEERANLVYATKIKVKNDGRLKIGMYGEVKFFDK